MGQQTSQLIAWSLEAPRPTQLPCGFTIVSQQLSRSQFSKSFKALHAPSQVVFMAKVIQLPQGFDAAPYVALVRSQHLSLQNLRFSLPFTYICCEKHQISLFRPLCARALHFGVRQNKFFLAYQMVRAVNEMHGHGVAHGSVRLSNFVATEQDEVFLTDALACKPLYVEDELQAQFYLGPCDPTRISTAAAAFFTTASFDTDLYELGLALYNLFYGDLSAKTVAQGAFQFKPELDDCRGARISINTTIQQLLQRKRVEHDAVFAEHTLIALSRLRMYMPGAFYSDLQFLLMVGQEYLNQRNEQALLYITSHLIARIYNVLILADVEFNVLTFVLECYKVVGDAAKKQILRLSFILLERLQMCQRTNYLLFFTRLLELIETLDAETYYFPFLVMCRFFVCSQLQKDIMAVLQHLRKDQYFDIQVDRQKQQSGQFWTRIDSFYLVNCFPRMYAQLRKFSQGDANLCQVSDVLFFSHQFSFLEKMILMCHSEVEQTGADQLVAALLRGMETASGENQYFISRIITLLNSRQKDVVATFLRFSSFSPQYLISVEQLIAAQCRSQDFSLEIAELFVRRFERGFSDGCALLLRFTEYLLQRISQSFFARHEISTGLRRGVVYLLARVVSCAAHQNAVLTTLRLNQIVRELFSERLRLQMQDFIKSNCGVGLAPYEEMPARLQQLLDDVRAAAEHHYIQIDFKREAKFFAQFRILLPDQLLDTEYLQRFVLVALVKSQQFYIACQRLVRTVQTQQPNYQTLKLNYAQQPRSEGHIEKALFPQILLPSYLRCYVLFPLQFSRQTTTSGLLQRLLQNADQHFLSDVHNPLLAVYFFNKFINYITCTRQRPLAAEELEQRIERLRRGSQQCAGVILSSSNANCLLCEDLYANLQAQLMQVSQLMRSAPVSVLQPERHVLQLSEHETWLFYRKTIENEVLQQRVFMHLSESNFAGIAPQLRRLHHMLQYQWFVQDCQNIKQAEIDGDLVYCLTMQNVLHLFKVSETQVSSDLLRFVASARNIANTRVYEAGTSYRSGNRSYQSAKREIHAWNATIQGSFQDLVMNQYYDTPAASIAFPFEIRYIQAENGILSILTACELFSLQVNLANLQLGYADAFLSKPRVSDQYSFQLAACRHARFNLFLSASERQSQLCAPRAGASMGLLANQIAARYTQTREDDIKNFRSTSDAYCAHCDDMVAYLANQEYIVGRTRQFPAQTHLGAFHYFELLENVPVQARYFTVHGGLLYVVSQHHIRVFCQGVLLRETRLALKTSHASFAADYMYIMSQNAVTLVDYELQVRHVLDVPAAVHAVHSFSMPQLGQYLRVCTAGGATENGAQTSKNAQNDVCSSSHFLALFTMLQAVVLDDDFNQVLSVRVEAQRPSAFLALESHLLLGFSGGALVQIDFTGNIINCELLEAVRGEFDDAATLAQGKDLKYRRAADIIIEQNDVYIRQKTCLNGFPASASTVAQRILRIAPCRNGILSVSAGGHLQQWK